MMIFTYFLSFFCAYASDIITATMTALILPDSRSTGNKGPKEDMDCIPRSEKSAQQ